MVAGLIAMLPSVPTIYNPPPSLARDPRAHLISSLQIISMLIYYPLENLTYLASKGVVPLSPTTAAKWSIWSVRAWAAYVFLDLVRLWDQRKDLLRRERALKYARENRDVNEKLADANNVSNDATVREAAALKADWVAFYEVLVNDLGYAPLTIHWSLPAGLWENQFWTGLFGTIACVSGIRAGWRRMGSA